MITSVRLVAYNDDVIRYASNPRYIAERFVNLLLEYVLGAIQSEWQPRESVSSVRRVECCVVGTFFIQLNIPVSTSGVKNGEKLSPIQLR